MAVGGQVTASITAADTFTDWLRLSGGGKFTLNISGISGSTVTLQRTRDDITGSPTAEDVETYTADTDPAELGEDPSYGTFYRVGVKSGEFGSGTITVTLRS